MISYKAKYYNGVSSAPFDVDIDLHEDYIGISYNSIEEIHEIKWPVKLISESSFLSKSELTLKFGDYPHQTLEIHDEELICEIHKLPIFNTSKRKYGAFYKGGAKTIIIASSIIAAVVIFLYLVVVPFIGEKAANLVPLSTEISMGQEMYDAMVSSYEIDSSKTKQINLFAKELNIQSDYPIEITVVKSKEQNAFALPGGHIIVYSEILENMKAPEQLAALLSHEASHVILQHSTKNICKSLATALVLSVIINDVNGISGIIIQNADNLKSLSYSRGLEEEADKNGLQIMISSKLNPQGMIQLFEQLKEVHKIDIPEFISTHPVSDKRIAYIKEEINKGNYNFTCPEKINEIWKQLKKKN